MGSYSMRANHLHPSEMRRTPKKNDEFRKGNKYATIMQSLSPRILID